MKIRRTSTRPAAKPAVLFASVKAAKPEAGATLPAKLDRLLGRLDLKGLCAGGRVPIKMHLGGGLGYSTIHPRLVRVVVDAVKKAGGVPFVFDGYFDTLRSAAERGYTSETLGCPILSAGGPFDSHVVRKRIGYRSLDQAAIFGAVADAPCLINLSHVKGHGTCGYGGACKNIAMGCVDGPSRAKIHALEGGIRWDKERCVFCGRCVKACDTGAVRMDRRERKVGIFFHHCRYCRHCVNACPGKALAMDERNGFQHFQEGMARATKAAIGHMAPTRVLHINVLLNITMLCDCWGMTTASLVPDIGILASHDMVAVDTASLDMIRTEDFIEGSLIGDWKLVPGAHLLERIYGKDPFVQLRALARQGLGSPDYRLEEVGGT